MAKFRCKQSGNIVEFHNEYDIEQTRLQEDYEEVEEEKIELPPEQPKKRKKPKDKQ